jgi:hypothetical protein
MTNTYATRIVLNYRKDTEIKPTGTIIPIIYTTEDINYDYFLLTFKNEELIYRGSYDDYMRNEDVYFRSIANEFYQILFGR